MTAQGIDAIRHRAAATLDLVGQLRRAGVIGAAVEAALRNSLGGQLVPPHAAWADAGLAPVVPLVDEVAADDAREDITRAVLRIITNEHTDPHTHSDAEAEYAEEMLDQAARRLVLALDGGAS